MQHTLPDKITYVINRSKKHKTKLNDNGQRELEKIVRINQSYKHIGGLENISIEKKYQVNTGESWKEYLDW